MCGITGWIDWEVDLTKARTVLEEMAQTLSCRGPDDSGFWLSPRAALAHRRLVVIDPKGGSQPMVRRRGEREYVITYNGELYNTSELRRELAARGHKFFGHSDTEVLLNAYIEWGTDCVERLNGIFAFAVWSAGDQRLFLARDRLGVKPLFYAQRGSSFLFGSEPKSLLVHPAIPAEVDAVGLAEIFLIGPARTPGQGIFRGLQELKPGHWLVYDRRGVQICQYWSLESKPHLDDLPATAGKIRQLLEDVVKRQLVSDVPLCTLLSGGLDSSAITAFAARELVRAGSGPLVTYSVDYVDNDRHFRPNCFQPSADAPWAPKIASFFGTRHRAVFLDTPELVDALPVALRARDFPGMVDIDASLYLFSRAVKRGATVALAGECADEIFGGYPWCRDWEASPNGTFPWLRLIRERTRLLSPELLSYVHPEEYLADRYREALAEVPLLPGESKFEARMRQILYLNITRWMPVLLDRMDRMSMAAGLEVRVPFCDHRLVEYAWNIPWAMKNCDGREKGILRRALAGVLPADLLARRKSPYPKTHNPTYREAVRTWLRRILADPAAPLRRLVNAGFVHELLQSDAIAFDPAWFGQLMGGAQLFAYLIQVDTWLREYRVRLRL
ncbi:MAG: asparagine synthase (glutamine-hydrolyzing) [Bacillota bacterium]